MLNNEEDIEDDDNGPDDDHTDNEVKTVMNNRIEIKVGTCSTKVRSVSPLLKRT